MYLSPTKGRVMINWNNVVEEEEEEGREKG